MLSETRPFDTWVRVRQADGSINLASAVVPASAKRANEFVESIFMAVVKAREKTSYPLNFSFRIFDALKVVHFNVALVRVYGYRSKVQTVLIVERIKRSPVCRGYLVKKLGDLAGILSTKRSPIRATLADDGALFAQVLADFPELKAYV